MSGDHRIQEFHELRVKEDVECRGCVSAKQLFLGDIRLVHNGHNLSAYRLKAQVPKTVAVQDASINAEDHIGADCAHWLRYSVKKNYAHCFEELFPQLIFQEN